eukprot:1124483-Prymnesium_polylepis.1
MPVLNRFQLVANLTNGALRQNVALALDIGVGGQRRLLGGVFGRWCRDDNATAHKGRLSECGI